MRNGDLKKAPARARYLIPGFLIPPALRILLVRVRYVLVNQVCFLVLFLTGDHVKGWSAMEVVHLLC